MAGFAIIEWTREDGGTIAYLQTLEVMPDRRAQGVGRKLLRRVEVSARAVGAEGIWLHVDAENVGAIRLYEANGYVCEGKEENFYARRRAALVYTKPLGAEPAS